MLKEALDLQLKNIQIDEKERHEILGNLQGIDKEKREVAMGRVVEKFLNKEKSERIIQPETAFERTGNRVKNWFAFKNFLTSKRLMARHLKKLERKSFSKRKPASKENKLEKPIVLLLMDGLRPDRLREAASKGLIPNISDLYLKHGREFNSFTSRSLTLPSWGTILTGHTPDQHGVRSNTPISRKSIKTKADYTDVRKDIVSVVETGKNRSLVHLHESGIKWIADYYDPEAVIMNYMPYSDGLNLPFAAFGKFSLMNLDSFIYGSQSGVLALDIASVDRAIKIIKKNPGKHKLIMNWFASIDVHSHHNNESLNDVYIALDKSIGLLVETLRKDPVLKDAHVFMISDHGLRGGFESKDSRYKLLKEGELLKNTGFNLTTFFAGDYFSHKAYNFVVKTFESPTPDHDLLFLSEFQVHPFEYVYRGKKKNQGKPTVMIDTSGDALAQIYLAGPKGNWSTRPSLHNMMNYEGTGKKINLIKDLLSVKLNSVVTSNPLLREYLETGDGFKPVEFAATWLKNKKSIKELKEKLGIKRKLSREPVLVFKGIDQSVIFASRELSGTEVFKYIPLKVLKQTAEGSISAVKASPSKDLFNYSKVKNFKNDSWYSDRQILNLLSDHKYPNAIYGLVKLLTLDRNISQNPERQGERPDLILMAKPGFNFNGGSVTEGDHGSIERVQVKNSLFLTKLGTPDSRTYKDAITPVMAKDILPTILKINGLNEKSVEWKPFWGTLFR